MKHRWLEVSFADFLRLNLRPYTLGPQEDANLVGMRWYGDGPFHRELKPALQIAKKTHFVIRSGDVIYNKLFAWKGSFGIVPPSLDGMFVSDKFPTYRLDRDKVDEGFLSWYFRYSPLWAQATARSTGSAAVSKLTLNPPQFLKLTMPLPQLEEQRRVVARIEQLAKRIESGCTLRQESTEAVEALRVSSLRSVMLRWDAEDTRLEHACSAIIDNLHSNPRYSDGGIPCVRSPDVGWGTLHLERALTTDEEEYRRRTVRGTPQADDIVLVREGGGTGKCALVSPGERFSLGQRVMMLRPDKALVEPRFFLYQLLSPLIQNQISTTGSASPHLNIGALRRFKFRLPSLDAQRLIVGELERLQGQLSMLKRVQVETSPELNALLPSILDRAFKGEL